MQRTALWLLILIVITSSMASASDAQTVERQAYQWMMHGLPSPNAGNTPFSYGRNEARETFLVQDTFVGEKAQLRPIADFFLSQPWYYWSCQTLDGRRTRSLPTVFGYRFGETFKEQHNVLGSMASIQGIQDAAGYQLGVSATLIDVLAAPAVKAALQEAVGKAFPDIRGDEWYADNVGLAVMLGVIGGRPDPVGNGLVFDGDAHVTRAEWIVMLNRLFSPKEYVELINRPAMSKPMADGVVPAETWFLQDYNFLVGSDGPLAGIYTLEELSQRISRAEAALFFNNAGYHFNLPTRFIPERIAEYKVSFADMASMEMMPKLLVAEGVEGLLYRPRLSSYLEGLTVTERLIHAQSGLLDFPYPLFQAITRLNLNKIMNGYPDGNLYPFEPLTRAQALALLFKASQLYPGSFLDDFDS